MIPVILVLPYSPDLKEQLSPIPSSHRLTVQSDSLCLYAKIVPIILSTVVVTFCISDGCANTFEFIFAIPGTRSLPPDHAAPFLFQAALSSSGPRCTMTDAGFFRGTNSEQDTRFSDKHKKLMKTMKFADVLSEKVDMKKVKLDTIKPWIATKITELLAHEDEVVVEYVFSQLEATVVDPKDMQINLTGFLNGKNAREFMRELWEYVVSAQANPSGIPDKFIEAKKLELREREVEQGRVSAAIRKTKDSISLLTAPIKTEAADTTKPGLGEGRDDSRRAASPSRGERLRSPVRQQRGFRSPQRTFRKSPSPRRPYQRRSGSRDGGRRSPLPSRGGRRSSPYRRRRSRSRSDSRSPKRMTRRSRSPMPRRAESPAPVIKVPPPPTTARRSSSSSSRSPSPANRRPIPRTNRRSGSSSSSSSVDVKKKKSASPGIKRRASSSPPPPVTTTSVKPDTARPADKSDSSQALRDKLMAMAMGTSVLPPVRRNRDSSRSGSRSPVNRRGGRNDRPSPPRYRKRSVSPPPNARKRSASRSPHAKKRSVSPPRYPRKRSPSPLPYARRRSPDRRDRSVSPRTRVRKNISPESDRNNGRHDGYRRRSPSPRRREKSVERPAKRARSPSLDRDVGKVAIKSEPRDSKPTVVSRKSASPEEKERKASGTDSDNEKTAKKAKKAKKEKKHKKHKKHHKKEKKSSKRKDISSDEEKLDIEQKLRARALECMRKDSKEEERS
ncbi:putative Serine/arginine repetitive matrix protein 1 [Hypsibius exemplaris]|uniref:Serine/arginine repetitive matrix protein 1 n=1 Tax=Hypsibius exemplaris TaxID=2072580 RepID=A0A9X6NB26_HYPEX|nr:putative Serine/arginine repetitive matrix protein 1 [Hypsibius exemplaris]